MNNSLHVTLYSRNHFPAIRDLMLWNVALAVVWDMKILEFYMIINPCKGIYVSTFFLCGWFGEINLFAPLITHLYTHGETFNHKTTGYKNGF